MIEERIRRYYVIKCDNRRCNMISSFRTQKEAEDAYELYWKPRNGLCTLCYERKLKAKG